LLALGVVLELLMEALHSPVIMVTLRMLALTLLLAAVVVVVLIVSV
jgi:hypothetical protein